MPTEVNPPLLSICVPTYNRAGCLRNLVRNLADLQLDQHPELEIVLSDNASSDDTPQVIAEACKHLRIKCRRLPQNLPVAVHMLDIIEKMASGEYCYLMGDDDAFIKGGIERLLDALMGHPEADFVFLNRFDVPYPELARLVQGGPITPVGDKLKPSNPCLRDCTLNSWQQTVEGCEFSEHMGPSTILAYVFRRRLWMEPASRIQTRAWEPLFWELEPTFPHTLIWSEALAGRKGYYIGRPIIAQGTQHQDWSGKVFTYVAFAEHFQTLWRRWHHQGIFAPEVDRALQLKYARLWEDTSQRALGGHNKPYIRPSRWLVTWAQNQRLLAHPWGLLGGVIKQALPLRSRRALGRLKRALAR